MATIKLFSASFLAAIALVGYVLLYLYRQIRQHRDIKRLGGYAPKVSTKVPFGLDIVYRLFRAGQLLDDIDIWHWLFSYAPYNRTVEFGIGGQRMIFTADPDNIRAVLAAQFGDYGKGEPFHRGWKEFLGDSIFTTDGQQWSESRNLLRPLFMKTRVRDFEVFERHTDKLMSLIEGKGEEVNLSKFCTSESVLSVRPTFQPYSHRVAWTANALRPYNSFTLDTSTDYLLGASVNSLGNGDNQFATHFDEVQRVQAILAKIGDTFGLFVPRRSFHKGLDFINNYVNLFIERVSSLNASELDTKEESYTFLHALSRYTSSKAVMRDQLVAILLAGRDSTAVTLSFIFHELSANPEILAKLRREILEKIGTHKTPSFEDIRNCNYLQKAISETLRIYPPVPYNVRLALRDTTLPRGGGLDGRQPVGIKKDTPIGYSAMLLHRNPSNYPPVSPEFPDISVFCPERWTHWTPKPWTYLPFNGGPRICIGQEFALTEIGYTVVRMLQRYERIDRYGTPGDMKLRSNIVLSPADGVRVGFWEG
ncbi:MAG: hypothetical protein HETSPECPRED_007043 [Heterodermia speciosa]|uniref:Cytochrome P450 n=1 Tax=Heterodermia speciosa TaxID=116794 RepID=A0A8H3I8D9_9LECA|nr:MAG: hypothetical protein HETSPECPRED_007043 [Heterodermia speciosa]